MDLACSSPDTRRTVAWRWFQSTEDNMKRPLLAAAAALLLATTAHAGDDDYAKQQEALKKDGVQHFDYVRFVATAEKTTLGNLYALSVDCSPQEGSIRVRIVNAPEHGSVASEQGRGLTRFSP